jgi:hypothetical protein
MIFAVAMKFWWTDWREKFETLAVWARVTAQVGSRVCTYIFNRRGLGEFTVY